MDKSEQLERKEVRQVADLANRYQEASFLTVFNMVCSYLDKGESFENSIIATRLVLGLIFGRSEYFSVEEAAALMGTSVDDVRERIEREGISVETFRPAPRFEKLFCTSDI